jgi:hypothetical protein
VRITPSSRPPRRGRQWLTDPLDLPVEVDAELGLDVGADGFAEALQVGGVASPVLIRKLRCSGENIAPP